MVTNNNLLYSQLIEKVIGERPELAQYAGLFQQLIESNSETSESQERINELEIKLKKTTLIAKRLKMELNHALDELDDFAKALGACECFGNDYDCSCKGKGKAGFWEPDREFFDKLIDPALNKISWLEIKKK